MSWVQIQELARRCDTLIRLVEKENEEVEAAEREERKKSTKKTSGSRVTDSSGGAGGGFTKVAQPPPCLDLLFVVGYLVLLLRFMFCRPDLFFLHALAVFFCCRGSSHAVCCVAVVTIAATLAFQGCVANAFGKSACCMLSFLS